MNCISEDDDLMDMADMEQRDGFTARRNWTRATDNIPMKK